MSRWFLMVQDPFASSVFDSADVVLSEGFVPNIRSAGYGYFPWYKLPTRKGGKPPPLPATGMCLICLEKWHPFDVRSIGGVERIFAMSERFVKSIEQLDTNFEDFIEAPLVDVNNERLSTNSYYVSRTKRRPFDSVIDVTRTRIATRGARWEISALRIADHVGTDIFTLENVSAVHDSPICSEKAMTAIEGAGVSGVRFIELSRIKWPSSNPAAAEYLALLNPDSDVPIMI